MRSAKGEPARVWAYRVLVLVSLCCGASRAWAGGARFISGDGWGVPHGLNVIWHADTVLYATDAGPLNAFVSHAQADAMVAGAAAVWSVPTSSISLAEVGALAEDVSAANVTFGDTGPVFPADVQASNEANVPVAIVYDADGSVIDLLLGDGASEPDGCRQNAVVGDVDDIQERDGGIHHATLILNGRCVGSAPEGLLQMQYQLARAFGRILGLSWSQTNDNVFTAATTVTVHQVANWPLMHPIDVICGNYTYQCMSDPFTLRTDDLNSLAQLYPVYEGATPPGKQGTSVDALWLWGILYFPTGQGMGWVNITTRRQNNGITEDWQSTSGITGALYEQAAATPLASTAAVNSGSSTPGLDGYFVFRRVPLNGVSNVFFTTEAVNPLYTGDSAIGPYIRPPATPSGTPGTVVDWSAISAGDRSLNAFFSTNGGASSCDPGADGAEGAPAGLDGSGWQTGLLCGWGHSSWFQVAVAAGHSWALEVTATDETGAASVNKAQPVLGMWSAEDPTGTQPTIASAPVPFNSFSLGMTQMQIGAADTDQHLRFSISDQFGAGRPDFTYTARLLYAASVLPATVGSGGGRIVISGSGFRQGNQVLVNGVPASVVSWSANQIVADAPTMRTTQAEIGMPVTITVQDDQTGGTATIPGGLSYVPAPDVLRLISAPPALETGLTAAVPFAVQVLASDGLSPVANAAVTLAVTSGSAAFNLCGAAPVCTLTTDDHGVLTSGVLGVAAGDVTLSATELSGGATLQVVLRETNPARAVVFSTPDRYLAAGANAVWTLQVAALQDGLALAGVRLAWAASAGLGLRSADAVTGVGGTAGSVVEVAEVAAGSVNTVTACAWSAVCATSTLYGVDPSRWVMGVASNAGQSVPTTGVLGAVTMIVTDGAGHLVEGAAVQIHQRVLAWEGACAATGRCAAAPVLSTSESSVTSDAEGRITIVPLQLPNIPQVVEVAASTGTQGFATLTLTKTP